MYKLQNEKGITLVALVITIIVLIILAGIAVSMTIGENGIFTRAKEAKKLQITAEAKEKIGADILDAQIEATQKDEQLQQSKVEEIISKYGELQADGDTIKLKDNGYEISLKEIYNGTTSSSGGSTGGSTGSAELDSLKAELAQTTATEDKILKDYKAYSNGKLMTGTMENFAGQTVTASTITENGENAEITIPQAGYYGTDSKISIPVETIKKDKIYYKKISSSRTNLGTNTHNVDFSDCPGFENVTISNFNIIAGNYYAQFDKNYNYYIMCKNSIDDYNSKSGILTIKTEFLGSGYNGESISTNVVILLNIE